ncbi:hypothetical protein F4818DRAFT_451657 [Hypoxylon cercidicola]|nr:hypothetical protein F4818DRAFT_451657 [Hypoxylon cercidicola]
MDKLPVELIEKIVSFLPYKGLHRFASISKKWQDPVERRTWACIRIAGGRDYLDDITHLFLRAFNFSGRRRTYLHTLKFALLVKYTKDNVHDTIGQFQEFTASISRDIMLLFMHLRRFDYYDHIQGIRTGGRNGLTLELGWVIPVLADKLEPESYVGGFALLDGFKTAIRPARCVSRLVLHTVSHGLDEVPEGMSLEARAAIQLAALLPRMKRLEIVSKAELYSTSDPERLKAVLHTGDRAQLIPELYDAAYLTGSSCTEVSLSLEKHVEDAITNVDGQPVFLLPDGNYDSVSPGIRMWSHNLVSLDLSGVFGETLFWPGESERVETSTPPASLWPTLKKLHVKLLCLAPAGSWYFDASDESSHRNNPCNDTPQPVFKSWAKALKAMPVIEQATIRWSLKFDTPQPATERDWLVGFQAPDTSLDPKRHTWEGNVTADMRQSPRLIFQNDNGWRPYDSTMRKLRKMGSEKFPDKDMIELEVDKFGNVTKV